MADRPVTIVWFGGDLRLADHPALCAAADRGVVVPVYVHAPEEEGAWRPGAASEWWLHHSLLSLDASLRERGLSLIVRRGPSTATLTALAEETGASAVFWNRRYVPAVAARDLAAASQLEAHGLETRTFAAALLHDPYELRTQSGGTYTVFTPFWKTFQDVVEVSRPLEVPALEACALQRDLPASLPVEALDLVPKIPWYQEMAQVWTPGEAGARARLEHFCDQILRTYGVSRDIPERDGTSMLSPHLRFGELSPRQVWDEVDTRAKRARSEGLPQNAAVYQRELGWREFGYHILVHYPDTPEIPLRPKYQHFPWDDDQEWLEAWQRGRTGYPIVDAGMRQLWRTGWMHNRVRMVVASFLTKDLLQPWQQGEAWFWDTLVDADLANNTLGWQWAAGCGADAQPFFRIFNPVTQGEKFDPNGDYVRRWVPELGRLPKKFVHRPWEAPSDVLERAGVVLGDTYPEPIVDHRMARERALEAFAELGA